MEVDFDEPLMVCARTSLDKVKVFYVRDSDYNPLVLKGPLESKEIVALLESERVKQILGLPRTNVRKYKDDYIISDCLYEYDVNDYHICKLKIDKGRKISNIKLKGCEHKETNTILERSFLKALAFRLIIGTDDTTPRNFIVIENTVYSIDDPAWNVEQKELWKIKNHKIMYTNMLDRNWEWVDAFLVEWKNTLNLGYFGIQMCEKYLIRKNWVF
jgi:hypothetical protein